MNSHGKNPLAMDSYNKSPKVHINHVFQHHQPSNQTIEQFKPIIVSNSQFQLNQQSTTQFSTITIAAVALFANNTFASPALAGGFVSLNAAETIAPTVMYNNIDRSLPDQ